MTAKLRMSLMKLSLSLFFKVFQGLTNTQTDCQSDKTTPKRPDLGA